MRTCLIIALNDPELQNNLAEALSAQGLQDFEIRPLGAEKPIWVDVRVITATNMDLEKAVERGPFARIFINASVW